VGAVFNRDDPIDRGWKPLPPTSNYGLNDIETFVVSYEMTEAGRPGGWDVGRRIS